MDPFSTVIINKVFRSSRSGMADAPVVAHEAPRRLRWFGRERAGRQQRELCEAEPRDRSPKVAGAARTC